MAQKEKIIWVYPYINCWMGGTKFIFQILKHLKEYADVGIAVCSIDDERRKSFEAAGIEVYDFKLPSTDSLFFWPFFHKNVSQAAKKLKEIVEKNAVTQVVSGMFPMNVICDKAGIEYSQYIFEPYAFFWDQEMIRGYPFVKRMLLHILKFIFGKKDIRSTQKARKLFTLTKDVEKCIKLVYKKESYPTGIGVNIYSAESSRYSEEFKNTTLLYHSTDFTPCKKTGFMIDVFEALLRENKNIHLAITVPVAASKDIENLKKDLQKRALEKHVHIFSQLSEQELQELLYCTDIAVYPGYSEGSGVSSVSLFVLECLAHGIPVVRTDTCKYEVLDQETGYVFERGNVEQCINRTKELITHKSKRLEMGQKARQDIKERFSWTTTAKKLWKGLEQ